MPLFVVQMNKPMVMNVNSEEQEIAGKDGLSPELMRVSVSLQVSQKLQLPRLHPPLFMYVNLFKFKKKIKILKT